MSFLPVNVVNQTNEKCSASVIFLHGSGDTGQGTLDWIKSALGDFSFPHINFYFPTASLKPYIPLQGERRHVWFNRYDITPEVPDHKESLESAVAEMKNFIQNIVDSGVPHNRIVIGGFSMGGALALHTAYRFSPGLAGVFALTSFLNNDSSLFNELKSKETPLYMCHGDSDTIVPISWAEKTFKDLSNAGIKGEFLSVENTLHELKKNEIEGLFAWIEKLLPDNDG